MDAVPGEFLFLILHNLVQKDQVPLRKVCKLWKELIDLPNKDVPLKEIAEKELYVAIP